MRPDFRPGTRMELDIVGQYYASTLNERQPSTFRVSAHLKEPVNPQVLQQAVNDLMRRLPFLNGRLRRGFLHYYHEILADPPQIVPDMSEAQFTDYYNHGGGHMLRFLYGERHMTVELTHSICDGRGLTQITRALLLRYFELLGVTVEDIGDITSCSDSMYAEEAEDGFRRYANDAKAKSEMLSSGAKTYQLTAPKANKVRVVSRSFSASKLKAAAKEQGATISEYILAHIFQAIASQRNAEGDEKPIAGMVPIDCRAFFPTKTFRSFVSAITITMPETKDVPEMVRQIRPQFTKINKEFLQNEINSLQKLYDRARFVPRALVKLVMMAITSAEAKETTSGLSNIGLVRLPKEIGQRVENMEFVIDLEETTALFFSCIAVGDKLTLTATTRMDSDEIVEAVHRGIKSGGG